MIKRPSFSPYEIALLNSGAPVSQTHLDAVKPIFEQANISADFSKLQHRGQLATVASALRSNKHPASVAAGDELMDYLTKITLEENNK